MSGRLSPTLDNEMQFFPIDNWQKEFIHCKNLNIQNYLWVIDYPTIKENPILDATKINNILLDSKKYDLQIIGIILHFFVQANICKMLETESNKLISILDEYFVMEIKLDWISLRFHSWEKLN